MDIGQAVRRLKNGDKIRRESWDDKEWFLDPEAAPDFEIKLTYEDLLANDWETLDG